MIELDHADLSASKQSSLLDCNRTSLYYKHITLDDTELANQIHEIYLKNKCIYDYRKITAALRHNSGVISNRKKVARIMREMKIVGPYPGKKIKTTIADLSHQKFAYLLKELIISFPNQVWATDITYIALPSGFVYLVAIIDIYSRYILDHKCREFGCGVLL